MPPVSDRPRGRAAFARPVRAARTRIEVIVIALVLVIGGVLVVPAIRRVNRAAARAACLQNLDVIGRAMSNYVQQSGGRWPFVAKLPSAEYHRPPWLALPDVLAPFMAGQRERFRCPGDRRRLSDGSPLLAQHARDTTYFETEGSSYEWVLQELYAGQPVGRDPLARSEGLGLGPADQPIIWEYEPFHRAGSESGSFSILYADFKARPQRSTTQLMEEKF